MNKKPVVLVVLVLLITSITLLVFAYAYRDELPNQIEQLANNVNQFPEMANSVLEPTPFPFMEMTVPYLRSKTYDSSLGELDKYSETSTYTSYLTSYTSEGLKINGLLTIPKNKDPNQKFPAIVFVHGYIAPTIYRTTEKYEAYVDYLARNGFVVFKIDLRGHDKSEGEPGGGYFGGDYVTDTLNAYSALQHADFVDANKIGLWGHSMAGNAVMRSVVVQKNIPAAVIWAGAVYTYTDMQELGINDNSYRPPSTNTQRQQRRQQLREQYGDPNNSGTTSWFWKLVAPTNYLDGVTTAINIHHAVNDDVVNIEYSRGLMKVLDGSSIEHQLYEYPSGGHNISGSSFSTAMKRTVDFYKAKLNVQ